MRIVEWLRWRTRYWPFGYYWWLGRKPKGRAIEASGTVSWSPPIERVCPACGAKHQGPWQYCSACKTVMDSGDSR